MKSPREAACRIGDELPASTAELGPTWYRHTKGGAGNLVAIDLRRKFA